MIALRALRLTMLAFISMVHRDDAVGGAAVVKNRRHVGSSADRLRWPGVRLPAITPQSIVRLN
jgi:hypothetical protein